MAIPPRERDANKRTILNMLETTPASVARLRGPSEPNEPLSDLDFDWRPRPLDRTVATRRSFRWSILIAAAVLGGLALVAVQVLITVPQKKADTRRVEYQAALDAYEPAVAAFAAAPTPSDPAALTAFADATAVFSDIVRADLPTVIPLLPIGPIEELRPGRSEMLAVADAAETLLLGLGAASTYRDAAASILALPFLPTSAPIELIDPAAVRSPTCSPPPSGHTRASMTTPAFAGYRERVAEAIDSLSDWADRYLLALRRGEVEATTVLVAEFQARASLATAELEAAVADVDAAAVAAIPAIQARLEEARIRLG